MLLQYLFSDRCTGSSGLGRSNRSSLLALCICVNVNIRHVNVLACLRSRFCVSLFFNFQWCNSLCSLCAGHYLFFSSRQGGPPGQVRARCRCLLFFARVSPPCPSWLYCDKWSAQIFSFSAVSLLVSVPRLPRRGTGTTRQRDYRFISSATTWYLFKHSGAG